MLVFIDNHLKKIVYNVKYIHIGIASACFPLSLMLIQNSFTKSLWAMEWISIQGKISIFPWDYKGFFINEVKRLKGLAMRLQVL